MQLQQILVGLGLLGLSPAFGQFTPISTPTGSYTGATTVMPIVAANFTSIPNLTNGTQTVTFSSALTARTVPTTWATWNSPPNVESNTPRVASADTALTTFILTLSTPASIFGFEIEPNAGVQTISANFMNGSTVLGTVTRSVRGSAGALLFAASSTTPITSVALTIPAGAAGFGFAQFRSTVTPAPTSVTPASGPPAGGNTVTITGTGFTGATSVAFQGAAASFTVVNDTTITATVPAGSTGAASIIITGPGGSNSANSLYQYLMPVPTLGEWGMVGLTALLILYGCLRLRGRREMAA